MYIHFYENHLLQLFGIRIVKIIMALILRLKCDDTYLAI